MTTKTETHVDEFASQGQSPGWRQTNEQRTATEALRALAGPYRVTLDPEGWPTILGRLGQIEHHDGHDLAVWFENARPGGMVKRLVEVGARRHQIGDTEARLLFPVALLGKIAQVIRAKRRRVLSPEQARRISGLAHVQGAQAGV